ncbi:MAG: hypothetical protein OXT06_04545 [Rhodospirillaceae bacterium]|nr:hypothetical protein [Rhodospirillaceae bacterium]MDD9929122.1 hypothetical protein [Rhodospirillaceae bacterium]
MEAGSAVALHPMIAYNFIGSRFGVSGVRMNQLRLLVLLGLAWGIAACQTSGGMHRDAGSGPITLSSSVKVAFEHYKQYDGWGFFAVSPDGQHFGFGGCPSLGACYNDGDNAALRRCKERSGGVPCKIYADGPNIVWQGIEGSGKAFEKTDAVPGSGPLHLSSRVQRNLERYLDFETPSAFAVSADGNQSHGIYCSNAPCVSPGAKEAAVARCSEKSAVGRCYLYAVGRKVVWQGTVSK